MAAIERLLDAAESEAQGETEEEAAFCAALFSDGRLYLERGRDNFTLQVDETRKLLRYLERIAA